MSGTTSEFEPASLIAPIPIIIFDVVAVVASLSLALILAPALLSPTVKRSKTWFTMITAMMIFPTLYLLNVRSQFDTGNAPPIGPCIVQAGFIYAGPPACTVAVLCFMIDRTLGLRATLLDTTRNQTLALILVALPSIVFTLVFFEAVLLIKESGDVHLNPIHIFCESRQDSPQEKITAVLTTLFLILTLGMEVWAVVMLYCNSTAVGSIRRPKTDIQLSVLIRIGVFTLTVAFAAGLGSLSLPNNLSGAAVRNIFLVTVPLLAALAFGTRDLLSFYAFWNRGNKTTLAHHDIGQV